jgi:transcriptional regulator with XRE-family HTH domain
VDELAKAIGERLKAERKKQSKTLVVIAWAAGCSVPEVSQYENGLVLPSTKRLLNLAAALGVSVADLVPEPYRSRKVPAEMPQVDTPPPAVSASP